MNDTIIEMPYGTGKTFELLSIYTGVLLELLEEKAMIENCMKKYSEVQLDVEIGKNMEE